MSYLLIGNAKLFISASFQPNLPVGISKIYINESRFCNPAIIENYWASAETIEPVKSCEAAVSVLFAYGGPIVKDEADLVTSNIL